MRMRRIIVPVYISRQEGNIEDFFNTIHLFYSSCADDTERMGPLLDVILLIIYCAWI